MNMNKVLENAMGGLAGVISPTMTGLIKSVLSPAVLRSISSPDLLSSIVNVFSGILKSMINTISSINVMSIVGSFIGEAYPMIMDRLRPLLTIAAPVVENALDMLASPLKAIGPLVEYISAGISPLIESLVKVIVDYLGNLLGSIVRGV